MAILQSWGVRPSLGLPCSQIAAFGWPGTKEALGHTKLHCSALMAGHDIIELRVHLFPEMPDIALDVAMEGWPTAFFLMGSLDRLGVPVEGVKRARQSGLGSAAADQFADVAV